MTDRSSTDRRNADRRNAERRAKDRRAEQRVPAEAPVRFLRAEAGRDAVLSGGLLDASAAGIRLLLDEPLGLAEKLLVEVRHPDAQCFNLTATVVWCEPSSTGERFRVGCTLGVELSSRQIALLNQLAVDGRTAVRAS